MQALSDELIANDISAYLNRHEHKSLLRFITCGSVDDGKSTLIGRLLYESKTLFEDQIDSVTQDSKKWGTQGKNIDFALLVDGLAAEREQGITIDVAYRFFSTDSRKFIVADTPGHEQYTRNMVTGASTADVAVILCDARHGLLTQTRRHSYLVSLLGIRNVVLAVNKMDLMDYSQSVYTEITEEYDVRMREKPFRMPVQWVNRPSLDFRGYAGTIASGSVSPGDDIRIQPSGRTSKIARVVTMDGDLDTAYTGQSVTITLEDEIDASRGDVISTSEEPASVADRWSTALRRAWNLMPLACAT